MQGEHYSQCPNKREGTMILSGLPIFMIAKAKNMFYPKKKSANEVYILAGKKFLGDPDRTVVPSLLLGHQQ